MPAFEFDRTHEAFVKECASCQEVTIGVRDQVRSEELFSKAFNYRSDSPDGFYHECKKCQALRARTNHLKRNYNITLEEFEALWIDQKGLCGICEKSMDRTSHNANAVCVDHIDGTEIVAGLLCLHCNTAIGLLKHNPKNFTKARDWCGRRALLLAKVG